MNTYTERMMTAEGKLERIATIDKMFEEATGWGSWMSEASDERRSLVTRLKLYDGIEIPHKWEKRFGQG